MSQPLHRLGALRLLPYFCVEEMAPLEILCLVLGWMEWSCPSILCLATEGKVGMATSSDVGKVVRKGLRSAVVH